MIKVRIVNDEVLRELRRSNVSIPAVLRTAVRQVLIRAADAVTKRIRNGDPLNQRSGRLAKSWAIGSGGQGQSSVTDSAAGAVHGELTSALAYAAIHEFGGTVKPKSGKYLAIPIGPNKMASGAIRASQSSPRQIPGLFFIRSQAGNLLGVTSGTGKLGAAGGGKRGPVVRKLTLWFLLLESVRIPPRRYVTLAADDAGRDAQTIVDGNLKAALEGTRG